MREDEQKGKKNFQVVFWASQMSLGTLASRVLGLVRDMVIANFFTRTQTDIFFVAFRFPNFFRRFLGESSFSASVTPSLTESFERDSSKKEARDFSSVLFTLLLIVTSFLTLVGIVFMENIMKFLFESSNYSSVEGKLEQTILLGQIIFSYLFLVSSYSYLMSMAQALGRFFLPALAPAFFNLSLILLALTPKSMWSFPAVSLGVGVVLGGIIQVLLVCFLLYKLDFWPKLSLKLQAPGVKSCLRRLVPSILALSGLSLIGLINLYFAGWLEEGSHTYIYYGDRLLELPRSLIAVSLGTALLPALSRFYAQKKETELFHTCTYYINLLIFLTLPCALVLYLIPQPIVEVLFERGEFTQVSSLQTSLVVKIYSVVLIFSSLARVLSSCFFAINKSWHCAMGNGLYICIHAVLAWFLTYTQGFSGLILATAFSSIAYTCLLAVILFYSTGRHVFRGVLNKLWKLVPSLLVFSGILVSQPYLQDFLTDSLSYKPAQIVSLAIVLLLAAVSYLIINRSLKNPMVQDILRLFR